MLDFNFDVFGFFKVSNFFLANVYSQRCSDFLLECSSEQANRAWTSHRMAEQLGIRLKRSDIELTIWNNKIIFNLFCFFIRIQTTTEYLEGSYLWSIFLNPPLSKRSSWKSGRMILHLLIMYFGQKKGLVLHWNWCWQKWFKNFIPKIHFSKWSHEMYFLRFVFSCMEKKKVKLLTYFQLQSKPSSSV